MPVPIDNPLVIFRVRNTASHTMAVHVQTEHDNDMSFGKCPLTNEVLIIRYKEPETWVLVHNP